VGVDDTFDLIPLRLHFVAKAPIHFPQGSAANLLRGVLGAWIMKTVPDSYTRRFAPEYAGGPSGLRQAPRPFVFRAAHLAGVSIAAGASFEFGINLFEARDEAVDLFAQAFETRFGPAVIKTREPLRLPVTYEGRPAGRLRIRFLTPTTVKGAVNNSSAEFGPLLSRIRDRTSTLRALYGSGPLELDFRSLGERAARVRMTRCELQQIEIDRTSRATGYTHPLGGFIGVAEYQGELGEFLPYLEIARWTGVGRQTVWGNGEIAWETF
jgi:CRISPR-associated endoribonuclease Cas6